jgi:hypothetical protein
VGAERLAGKGDFLAVIDENIRFQVPFLGVDDLQREAGQTSTVNSTSTLALPAVEETEEEPQPDDIELLAARLKPWWSHNGNRWGSKTGALKHLFGDVPPGGWQWERTMEAIARLEVA